MDREVSGCGDRQKSGGKRRWFKIDQFKGMGSGTQSATRSICIGTLYANCLKTISVQNSVQNARFDWGKSGAQVESGAEKWLECSV